jgi:hypothetical protein
MAKLNPVARQNAIANSVERELSQLAAAAPDLTELVLSNASLASHTLRIDDNPRSVKFKN